MFTLLTTHMMQHNASRASVAYEDIFFTMEQYIWKEDIQLLVFPHQWLNLNPHAKDELPICSKPIVGQHPFANPFLQLPHLHIMLSPWKKDSHGI